MRKLTMFFAILAFFGILAAQEAQNEPAAAQETKESTETVKSEEPESAENQAPAAQNESPTAGTAAETAQEAPVQEENAVETEPVKEEEKESSGQSVAAQPAAASQEPVPAETKDQTEEPAKKPEETIKQESEPVKEEQPSKVFYQLSAGIGLGASLFSMRLNNDIDFLLKHTKNGTNFYMGLEIDFRYSPYIGENSIYEIPIQANIMFDFPLNHRNLSRIALWFSAGVDMAFGYPSYYYDYDDDVDEKDCGTIFKAMAAWGFGVNMLFKNDVTLKLGFDSFYGKYPDIICAVGYRFY